MMVTKNEYFESSTKQNGLNLEYARVAAFTDNKEPLLQFLGEQTISPKVYTRMKHYNNPELGDRVMLLNNVIIGGWQPNA